MVRDAIVATRGIKLEVDRSPKGAREVRVHGRRIDALDRLYLAMRGVRVEAWLSRDTVPVGGKGQGYVVVHGSEMLSGLRVSCGARAADPVRQPVRQTPFDDRPRSTPKTAASAADARKKLLKEPPANKVRAAALPGRFAFTFVCAEDDPGFVRSGPVPSSIEVTTTFELDGLEFVWSTQLSYTPVDPVALSFDREVVLVPAGKRSERLLSVVAQSHAEDPVEAPVQLQMGPGITASATPSRLRLTKEQREARLLVRAEIDAAEMTADAGLSIGFGDARVQLPLRLIDVSVPDGLSVGLVRGPEDTTERTLADLGIPFVNLDRDALVSTNLDQFSVVFLDIRAYHHRPELAEVRERLQQYCRGGGRVVSMYHKPGEWNAKDGHPLLSPFGLTVGNERVTEEDAAVELLNPDHRLMSHPHRIIAADFDGWVQERGLNFPKTWDDAWLPMLGMKDSGEREQHQGSLLYTSYGKGDFVYCSLSLYRQLRKGNRGAVRLLVNLLSR